MSYDGYLAIARVYDKLNKEIDYSKWASFFESCFERYGGEKPSIVLDLACGTGRMTCEMAQRGYDMIGVDGSVDMLSEAYSKDTSGILYLCQDMRELELYGTVDAVVSTLDCLNHLTNKKDLEKTLHLVHNYLIPDGLFVFDINGKGKFERIYANNSYVSETENGVCVWQNYYNEKTNLCDFYITVFSENADGSYARFDDVERERMYTVRSIKTSLLKCNFEFIGAFKSFDFENASDDDERIYIVAKCKKTN